MALDQLMPFDVAHDPALVLALALAAGIICQMLARHLRVPGEDS